MTAALLVVGVGVIASRGNPLKSEEVVQGPSRLSEGSLNSRWDWWKEAWDAFEGQPLGGTGAGSFELVHRKLRTSNMSVREVHNLPLQFASETGLVGLLLAGGRGGGSSARRLARARGGSTAKERAAAVALGVALPTFLVHGALDYDWEFVALCGPLFFVTGVLLATGREAVRVRRPRLGARARPRRVGGAVLDRGSPVCGGAGQRRVRARSSSGSVEKAVVGGEERALARSALDRAARGLGLRGGVAGAHPHGAGALRAGRRAPASELGAPGTSSAASTRR